MSLLYYVMISTKKIWHQFSLFFHYFFTLCKTHKHKSHMLVCSLVFGMVFTILGNLHYLSFPFRVSQHLFGSQQSALENFESDWFWFASVVYFVLCFKCKIKINCFCFCLCLTHTHAQTQLRAQAQTHDLLCSSTSFIYCLFLLF